MRINTLLLKFFVLVLVLVFSNVSLFGGYGSGGGYGGGGGGGGGSYGGGGDDDDDADSLQFDAWNSWIGDENHFTEAKDRNSSTKIVKRDFNLTFASIDKDDTKYEKKKAKDGETNVATEVGIYTNEDPPQLVSNTVSWNPTNDNEKYIKESASFHVDSAQKNLLIGTKLCASYDSDTKEYILYNLGSCDETADCDENSSKKTRVCYASNNFAVRPKLFYIKQEDFLKSARDYNLSVIARDGSDNATKDYNLTNTEASAGEKVAKLIDDWGNGNGATNTETKDYNLSLEIEKYRIDNEVNNSLYGEGNVTLYKFKDGNASDEDDDKYVSVYYTDVGKINLLLLDQNWSDVDKDDTPAGCSNEDGENMGRYICGDTNITYIPDHFSITNQIKIYDHNNSTFTYIANDYNMSAHIEIDISARNGDGNITKNFDIDSWIHPISVDFNTSYDADINKSVISDTNLSFEDGKITIKWDEENLSKNLLFNYTREVNSSRNPFMVKADDINISILSRYGDFNISDDNGSEIGGDDSNATFLYARTNIPRTRFVESDTYRVNIYYETFCYATDKYDNDCNKSLLPDGEDSNITDDPRWFVNSYHNNSSHKVGKSFNVTQKRGEGMSVDTNATGNHQDSVTLKYSGTPPYKTTMQTEASSWLIYKKYDPQATTAEFEIELNKRETDSNSWAGKSEEGVSNTDTTTITTRTNRRSMW